MTIAQAHCSTTSARSESARRGRVCAELSSWVNNRAGVGFGVTIEAITATTVDFTSSGRLKVGEQYLLEIPRPGEPAIRAVCNVVRCGKADRCQFELPLPMDEFEHLEQRLAHDRQPMVTSRRTKLLFILFGIVGMGAAIWLDWP